MGCNTFSIKRGATWKAIQYTVRPAAGSTLPDVAGATGVLLRRPNGTTQTRVQMTGAVTVAAVGSNVSVTYAWASGDTASVADWDAEFEVTLASGAIWTIPDTDGQGRPQFLRIIIAADLGDPD